jgi:hypothetical protein
MLLKKQLRNVYSSPNMIRVTKYREMNRTRSTHGAVKIAYILVRRD